MLRAPAFRKREGTPAHVIGVLNQPAPVDPAYPATPGLPEHISPTSAKAYLACSLKFFFEKLVRLAKPVPVALHCGKAVHAALQAFHLARWRGRDDSPEVIAAAFEGAFVALERDEGPVNCADAAAREKARNDGLRVVATLETAVAGIAAGRFHPQPGMQCSWCQFRAECAAWTPQHENAA